MDRVNYESACGTLSLISKSKEGSKNSIIPGRADTFIDNATSVLDTISTNNGSNKVRVEFMEKIVTALLHRKISPIFESKNRTSASADEYPTIAQQISSHSLNFNRGLAFQLAATALLRFVLESSGNHFTTERSNALKRIIDALTDYARR